MSTMKKTFKPQFFDLRQTVKLSIGITADDHKKLQVEAKQEGLNLPDYCRKKLNLPLAGELKARRAQREEEYRKRNPFY
jgi:hypothetical protein